MKAPVNTAVPDNVTGTVGGTEALLKIITGMEQGVVIEASEAEGQKSLVSSDTLPTDGLDAVVAACPQIKKLGAVQDDPLFTYVELPSGWTKKATEHAMWSHLLDDRGRQRASIFYKAAFYDRRAHIHPNRRFAIEHDYKAMNDGIIRTNVQDCGQITRTFVHTCRVHEAMSHDEVARYKRENNAAALAWLEAQYPDWENDGAYWDEP